MDYPLNVTKKAGEYTAFAVANDEAEHAALTEQGYEPKYEGEASSNEPTKEELQAKAKEIGIEFDSRWGVKKLQEEIAKAGA